MFRIINSTNDVIYSRIMKPKNRNYICVKDCGRFNPNTRKVTKVDKPLKLDLLVKRKRKKAKVQKGKNEKVTKRGVSLQDINVSVTNRAVSYENNNNGMHGTYGRHATKKKKKEDLNKILSEDVKSESNSQNDYIIVSIEQKAPHKVKSRRQKKPKLIEFGEGVTVQPNVTPEYTLRDGLISIEELQNEGFE